MDCNLGSEIGQKMRVSFHSVYCVGKINALVINISSFNYN